MILPSPLLVFVCKLFFMTLTSHPQFLMLLGAGRTYSLPSTDAPVLRPTMRHGDIECSFVFTGARF